MADIIIHEVGPRDGLQAEKQVVSTEKKLAWIRCTHGRRCGHRPGRLLRPPREGAADGRHGRALPRARGRTSQPRAILSGLVLNEKGLERGLACGVEMFCFGVSASETHSKKNTGMGTDEAQRRIIATAKQALAAGKQVQVSVQSAFGCGFDGPVPEARVLAIVNAYLEAGLTNISLADTAGHAHPEQVRTLFGSILALAPTSSAPATSTTPTAWAWPTSTRRWQSGVTSFETSFAGLGGCPFTKVAAGNVATEDLVHALHRRGLRADVDLDAIIAVARDVAAHFGREMPGRVYKTGPLSY